LSNNNNIQPVASVDALGQRCPMPLLMAKRALRDVAAGDVLEVIADDPGSTRDFAAFAKLAGHVVATETTEQGYLRHLITKA
jgi:TusA-related sulfurtransferase